MLGRDQHAAWAAVDVLADGLRSRLAGVEGLLEKPGLVKRIALMSGGVPRDAVRILRGAVLSAARRGGPVSMADVVAGEREVRQDLEQAFVRGDVEALRYVFNDRRFVEHDPRLLTMGAVVQYEDEEGTYALPHPLLWAGIGVDHSLRTEAVVAANAP